MTNCYESAVRLNEQACDNLENKQITDKHLPLSFTANKIFIKK